MTAEHYTDETLYSTEEAANIHGITLGQKIIDGKAPRVCED